MKELKTMSVFMFLLLILTSYTTEARGRRGGHGRGGSHSRGSISSNAWLSSDTSTSSRSKKVSPKKSVKQGSNDQNLESNKGENTSDQKNNNTIEKN